LFGVYPAPVLDVMHESVANLIHNHEVAMQAARDVATVAK